MFLSVCLSPPSLARTRARAQEHIIPKVLSMVKNPHYLYRLTVLSTVAKLAPVVGKDVTVARLLPVVIDCAKDRVPNIKFNVARLLQELVIPLVDAKVIETVIRPCLTERAADGDSDVKFFAGQALRSCGA